MLRVMNNESEERLPNPHGLCEYSLEPPRNEGYTSTPLFNQSIQRHDRMEEGQGQGDQESMRRRAVGIPTLYVSSARDKNSDEEDSVISSIDSDNEAPENDKDSVKSLWNIPVHTERQIQTFQTPACQRLKFGGSQVFKGIMGEVEQEIKNKALKKTKESHRQQQSLTRGVSQLKPQNCEDDPTYLMYLQLRGGSKKGSLYIRRCSGSRTPIPEDDDDNDDKDKINGPNGNRHHTGHMAALDTYHLMALAAQHKKKVINKTRRAPATAPWGVRVPPKKVSTHREEEDLDPETASMLLTQRLRDMSKKVLADGLTKRERAKLERLKQKRGGWDKTEFKEALNLLDKAYQC